MQRNRRQLVASALAVSAMTVWNQGTARAQQPAATQAATAAAPLRVIIGFSRHSASDDLLRNIEPDLAAALGRPVQIDLLPGDLGARGIEALRASPPDGNTILVATFGTHAINPILSKDLRYDPVRDFAPICLATRSPLVLGTRSSLGANSVADLVGLAGRQSLSYGSSGVGSAPYLAGLLFQRLTGVTMVHRAYADTRKLYEDLQAGALDLSFNNAASMLPLVRSGKLQGLAVTTPTRSPAKPDLPTMEEAGVKGFALNNWLGFVAPADTPKPIVAELNRAIVATLRTPNAIQFFSANGIEAVGSTSQDFGAYIAEELKRWSWLRDTA